MTEEHNEYNSILSSTILEYKEPNFEREYIVNGNQITLDDFCEFEYFNWIKIAKFKDGKLKKLSKCAIVLNIGSENVYNIEINENQSEKFDKNNFYTCDIDYFNNQWYKYHNIKLIINSNKNYMYKIIVNGCVFKNELSKLLYFPNASFPHIIINHNSKYYKNNYSNPNDTFYYVMDGGMNVVNRYSEYTKNNNDTGMKIVNRYGEYTKNNNDIEMKIENYNKLNKVCVEQRIICNVILYNTYIIDTNCDDDTKRIDYFNFFNNNNNNKNNNVCINHYVKNVKYSFIETYNNFVIIYYKLPEVVYDFDKTRNIPVFNDIIRHVQILNNFEYSHIDILENKNREEKTIHRVKQVDNNNNHIFKDYIVYDKAVPHTYLRIHMYNPNFNFYDIELNYKIGIVSSLTSYKKQRL